MSGFVNLWNEIFSVFSGSDQVQSKAFANAFIENEVLKIQIAAPGHELDDFIIAYNMNYQQLSVRAKQPHKVKTVRNWLRHEFDYNSFTRLFQIENTLDKEKMQKRYESGILYLEFPIIPAH
jgi:HSP20 family protein